MSSFLPEIVANRSGNSNKGRDICINGGVGEQGIDKGCPKEKLDARQILSFTVRK
jgi:hypothetical protein